jgi:hypothetical protein
MSNAEIHKHDYAFGGHRNTIQTGAPQFMARLIQRARETKVVTLDLDNDPETRNRLRHVLGRHEKLGQFFARTGLAKSQIAQMSKSEITAFVSLAAERAKDDPSAPSQSWEPKSVPPKFIITD